MLLGAFGTLLVLVVMGATLWWTATDPADTGGERPSATTPTDAGGLPDATPPTDLSDGEAWFEELRLDAGTVVAEDSLLRDVSAVGHDVTTSPDAVVAQRVSVEATVPFEVVAAEIGDGTSVGPAADGRSTVVRTVEVLGRDLTVTATGTVVAESGRLVVEPTSIDIGGLDFISDAVATVVRQLVTIEHEVEGLPEGLVLEDVDVHDDGFRARLRGEDVQLVP